MVYKQIDNLTPTRPLICVILRTYEGHTDLLPRAIRSVLAQDMPKGTIELVIASDGPPSERTEVIIEAETQNTAVPTKMIWSEEHTGYYCMSSNIATIFATKAPFIAYLDADNEWRPNHLSGLLEALRTPDEKAFLPHFVYARREYVRDEGAPENLPVGASPLVPWELGVEGGLTKSPMMNFVDSSDFLIPRSVLYYLAERDGFMWNPEVMRFGDWDLIARLALLGARGKAVDQISHIYHWGKSNLQHTRPTSEIFAMPESMYEKMRAEGKIVPNPLAENAE